MANYQTGAYILYFNNNYAYVGISHNREARVQIGHLLLLEQNRHYNRFMQRVYNKHGFSHYEFDDRLVDSSDKRACNELEHTVYAETAAKGYDMVNMVVPGRNANYLYDFDALHFDTGKSERCRRNALTWLNNNPDARRIISERTKVAMQRPEVYDKMVAGIRAAFANPELKQKISKCTKEAMQREDVKQRHLDAVRRGHNTDTAKANYRRRQLAEMSTVEARQQVSISTKAAMQRPEVKAKVLAGLRALYDDPVRKALYDERRNATLARRKDFIAKYGRIYKYVFPTDKVQDYMHFVIIDDYAYFFVWDIRNIEFKMHVSELAQYRLAKDNMLPITDTNSIIQQTK